MTNLVESSQWDENLYQLETGDPVLGGPDGVSNKQAKTLGGRTRYLKAQVEQSQSGLAQHVAAPDPHSQYALKTDLATKLAALVGQSPQSLDTLKELADALGNDPNFATTVLNALALKAAIDSPTFTGAPKGTTPPQFDSSIRLATTAFVQRARGNFQARKYINGSGGVAASDTGSWVEAGGSGPTTITLPAPTTDYLTYTITNVTSNGTAVTISTPSASIYNQASAASTFSLDVGATVELVSDASNWTVISHYTRSPIAQTAAQFDNSTRLATTAFVKQCGVSFTGIQGINTTASLNSGHVGAFLWAYGAGTTLTLPPVSGVPNGATITIGTPVGITVKGNASENINNQFAATSNTLSLSAGEQAQFVSNGGAWFLSEYSTVSGTTAPQFDSSTKLATTAFVQRALGSYSGFSLVNASSTLTVAAAGQLVELNGNSTFTTTLPVGASVVQGGKMAFVNQSSANQTIAVQSSDLIWSYAGGLVSSISLRPGDSLELVSRVGQWDICGGSVLLQFSSSFGSQLGTSGYQKLPSGLIIQWGTFITNSSGTQTVTLPLAFPSAQLGAVASVTAANTTATVATGSATKSSLTIGTRDFVGNSGIIASGIYFAWGY